MLDAKVYYALLGLSTGWITAFPAIRPLGLPVPYAILALAALVAPFTSSLLIERSRAALAGIFATALSLVAVITIFGDGGASIAPLLRSIVGFVLFALVLVTVRSSAHLIRVLTWALPFWTASQLVALAQFFGIAEAVALPILLLPEESFADDEVLYIDTIRIFGLLGLPHVFAYGSALWTLTLMGALQQGVTTPGAKLAFGFCASLSFVVTLLSAQRSAVWPLVLVLILLVLIMLMERRSALLWILCGLCLLGASVWLAVSRGIDLVTLRRLTEFETGTDRIRFQSWLEGYRALLADPLLGSAYDPSRVGVGVHNGFIRGWAQFGIVWLALVGLSLVALVWTICRSRIRFSKLIVPLGIIGSVVFNSMSHTLIFTINDLITWPFLAIAVILAGNPSESVFRLAHGTASSRTETS